jgi:hypothetical protein
MVPRLPEDEIDWLKYECGKARPLLTIPQQARPIKFDKFFEHHDQNKFQASGACS